MRMVWGNEGFFEVASYQADIPSSKAWRQGTLYCKFPSWAYQIGLEARGNERRRQSLSDKLKKPSQILTITHVPTDIFILENGDQRAKGNSLPILYGPEISRPFPKVPNSWQEFVCCPRQWHHCIPKCKPRQPYESLELSPAGWRKEENETPRFDWNNLNSQVETRRGLAHRAKRSRAFGSKYFEGRSGCF